MIPASFDYHRPSTLAEALALLGQSEDCKVLAGGHSLVPAMKLRLAQPKSVIDIGRIAELNYIRERNGQIVLGAMVTHYEIESSGLLKEKCPLLAEVAPKIGDVQVRHKGTLGGSLVHADPAADFFVEMMQSAVQPNEILCEIRVPVTSKSVAYVKFAQKASGFAIAGVAAVVDKGRKTVAVGVTGVAPKPYRARAVENALQGKELTPQSIREASAKVIEEVEPLSDIHASAEFRAHLAQVNCWRAIELAAGQ